VNLHSVVAPDRLFSFNNGRNKHDISAQLDRVCSTSTQFQRQTVHINVLSVTHIKDEKKYMMQNNNLLQKKTKQNKNKNASFRVQIQISNCGDCNQSTINNLRAFTKGAQGIVQFDSPSLGRGKWCRTAL